jgi:predicted Fe-Mo cluster-binding NifX family protein
VAVAAENDQGLKAPVSAHFGRAPYYALVDISGTEISSCSTVNNPFYAEHGTPGRVPAFVNDQDAHVIIAGGMGARAVAFFEQYGIEAVTGAQGTVGESVSLYLNGELKGTISCKHSSCHDEHGELT